MTSLTYSIHVVVSPPCGSSSFPAYRGSVLVKTVLFSLLPLVCTVSSLLTLMTPVTSWARILNEATATLCTLHSLLWPLLPLFTFECWKRVRPQLGWLYYKVTRVVAGHPSSGLSQAFHQFKFAIHVIFPDTLAGFISWSGPGTQECFTVTAPPLAGLSTIVHPWLILQNAPPYYVRSPLSARQVASV